MEKVKFIKLQKVFLSSMQPQHFSGFPGLYLTCREATTDYNKFNILLHGPKGLYDLIGTCKPFLTNLTHIKVLEYKIKQNRQINKEEESKGEA
jgi:hypothetical protein